MAKIASSEEFTLGKRCKSGDDYAIIRYFGEVDGNPGLWVGVEWDNRKRGKHDGTHKEKCYFKCEKSGNCASFLRTHKITFGKTFMEVVKERYSYSGPGEKGENLIVGPQGGAVKVELVGMDSVYKEKSKFDELTVMCLESLDISSPGEVGEIDKFNLNVEELHISENKLIEHWDTVSRIVGQLKKLKSLELSGIQLNLPINVLELKPSFENISILYLYDTGINWDYFTRVSIMFPSLKEVYLCFNRIASLFSEIEINTLCKNSIELISLEDNELSDWKEIYKLQDFPQLSTLNLNDNKLPDIPSKLANPDTFCSLSALSLKNNEIYQWGTLSLINSTFKVKNLKLKGNPLFEGMSVQQSRHNTIARIESITTLNNSDITSIERHDAELYYVSTYSKDWQLAVDPISKAIINSDFFKEHPRFSKLIEKSGEPMSRQPPLTNTFYDVIIKCPDDSTKKEYKKKLPMSLQLLKFKGILQRLYGINSSDQIISYVTKEGGFEYEMDDNMRSISFYGLQSGNIILVREKSL